MCTQSCAIGYFKDTHVTFTVTPASGWAFVSSTGVANVIAGQLGYEAIVAAGQATYNTFAFAVLGSGTIATAAGDGTPGYSGDGSLAGAINAQLNWPWGVAVGPSGNIYVADANNNRVRQVATSTDVITTVAGNGTGGYSGDGGPATGAALSYPTGLALDSAGNIYIASSGSRFCVIRKVTASTGIITTIAGSACGYGGDGGPAISAYLTFTSGMAVDPAGNLYIVQYQPPVRRLPPTACAIRKVTASTGIITTIAGGYTCGYSGDGGPATSAELWEPAGVAVDSSGNVYIGDGSNNRVRTVNASTGIITTVAGNGTAGYSGDGGPAVGAELNFPAGLVVDSAGDIYFSDSQNDVIRKVSASTGVITTVAGNGVGGHSGDGGPATGAELLYPWDVALDSFNNLYISDTQNNRVRIVEH